MKEPWCLVASDAEVSAKTLVSYRAKRCGIEASFRDLKDLRYSMRLSWSRVSQPARRERLLLFSAFAIALLSLGAAGESLGYDRMLKANTVKRRTHSLFRQGLMLYDWLPTMRQAFLRPLMQRFNEMLLQQQALKQVIGVLRLLLWEDA